MLDHHLEHVDWRYLLRDVLSPYVFSYFFPGCIEASVWVEACCSQRLHGVKTGERHTLRRSPCRRSAQRLLLQVPSALRSRVHDYFDEHCARQKMFDEDTILSCLSPSLRLEIVKHCRSPVFNTVWTPRQTFCYVLYLDVLRVIHVFCLDQPRFHFFKN